MSSERPARPAAGRAASGRPAQPSPGTPDGGVFTRPIGRRSALRSIGGGILVAGAGLPAFLAACAAPRPTMPVWVPLELEPAALAVALPTEVSFTARSNAGEFPGTAWLVRSDIGGVVAFNPSCTHQQCIYAWTPDEGRFVCACHEGAFALDGTVLEGPPPRPLDRYPTRLIDGRLQVRVPVPYDPDQS